MNNVLAEIIDDELNKDILVFDDQNFFGKIISDRGMRIFNASLSDNSFFLKDQVDAALIIINLSQMENSNLSNSISNALKNANVLNKLYIYIFMLSEQMMEF